VKGKGQIISLDFLISIAAMTLAIGLLIQFAELKTYNEKEELRWTELKEIAETASDLLVSGQSTVCEMVDASNGHLLYLNNCISSRSIANATKEALAIPSRFSCLIETTVEGTTDPTVVSAECSGNPSNAKNAYTVSRRVVVYQEPNDNTVPKSGLEECMNGAEECKLKEGTISLTVWGE
jgi:hypothetical protein